MKTLLAQYVLKGSKKNECESKRLVEVKSASAQTCGGMKTLGRSRVRGNLPAWEACKQFATRTSTTLSYAVWNRYHKHVDLVLRISWAMFFPMELYIKIQTRIGRSCERPSSGNAPPEGEGQPL